MEEAVVGKPSVGCWGGGAWNPLACPGFPTDQWEPALPVEETALPVGVEAVACKGSS